MKLGLGYRQAVKRAGSEPYCFYDFTEEFDSLADASKAAKRRALANGAQSVLIWDDATFANLTIWWLVDGEWVETLH